MKKIVCVVLSILLCLSVSLGAFAAVAGYRTIYAPDGRTATVAASQVQSYLSVGWYDYPVVTMYASDGRSIVVDAGSVKVWESVGWYDGRQKIAIYAPGGRVAYISPGQLASYKAVGWYDYPVTTLYASGGRTITVATSSISQWLAVGWSTTPVYDYVTDYDRRKAKEAVSDFVYAYASFVYNGYRDSGTYYNYMSPYSPSWSNAYKTQWDYFVKHYITYYTVQNVTFESVTNDGNTFYVVDYETIGETKDGVFTVSTSKWKYTVVKEGDTYMVTNYAKAN